VSRRGKLAAMPTVRSIDRFAAHLRALREERELSQTRLAELAGLNRNYVGDVERGRRNPCLDNILKLADALDISPSELFRPFEKRR
jgi:transcriptional regulator with XRE-family HTH domain